MPPSYCSCRNCSSNCRIQTSLFAFRAPALLINGQRLELVDACFPLRRGVQGRSFPMMRRSAYEDCVEVLVGRRQASSIRLAYDSRVYPVL